MDVYTKRNENLLQSAFFSPLISFAQQGYNVVKDYGFENNDTIWVEFAKPGWTISDRHGQPGYESKFSGITEAVGSGSTGDIAFSYLEQTLTKREAKDYHADKNLRFFTKIYLPNDPSDWDYWYISLKSGQKTLLFLYAGNGSKLPTEDETTHVVKEPYPTSASWAAETLDFYNKWIEKFSDTGTIEKIRLAAYGIYGVTGAQGQRVWWDDIVFESTRPDSDAAVVDVGFSGIPSAKVENRGAVAVSFPTICEIFQGSTRVYSDTVNVDSLAVDSIKQVSFKPYSDTGEMKIYTALPGDQNPGNDTLSKNLGVQEVVIKKPLEFKVLPTLTKGMINISSPNPIRIYNIYGRAVASGEPGVRKFTLTPSGVYFIKSGGEMKKIVKI